MGRSWQEVSLKDAHKRSETFNNYLIFYRAAENGIEIIRVLHAKRDIDSMFGGQH